MMVIGLLEVAFLWPPHTKRFADLRPGPIQLGDSSLLGTGGYCVTFEAIFIQKITPYFGKKMSICETSE